MSAGPIIKCGPDGRMLGVSSKLSRFRFFLGTHKPHWLGLTSVPLFISRRRLQDVVSLPRALGPWCLDSGGFTELKDYGEWTITPREYVAFVRRCRDEIGNLVWAAPMDWMCERVVIKGLWDPNPEHRFRGTGLSVKTHIKRTVRNYLELMSIAPDLPFIPVIQGWTEGDYWDCIALYERHGVRLHHTTVGLGSICRRQDTMRAGLIVRWLALQGLRIHGFGFKMKGLVGLADAFESSDSLAWSSFQRRRPPIPEHAGQHKSCANCLLAALRWRDRLLRAIAEEDEGDMPDEEEDLIVEEEDLLTG